MTAYDWVQSVVQPLITDALFAAALALLAWIGRLVPAWLNARIDQINRLALHSALDTGAALVLDGIQAIPTVAAMDAAVTQVLAYVRRSVPGALRRFAPTEQQLADMARAKISDALTRRDALADALKEAGAPER
ncbi:MAG: hypothetical protein Q4G49_10850 [Paracoccus sp. (in: a-proteobacteria)]|nr:hypothetical protein [Paracoccus sp. (in: a-proteobacteria)]